MQQFSKAYVSAIASAAECSVSDISVDIDSLDVSIRRRTIGTRVRSPHLDVQLKSTYQDCLTASTLSYQLDKRAYDDLRDPDRSAPCILVVLYVPDLFEDWTAHSEAELLVRRCAYWRSLRGLPDLPNGQQSKTIHIPRTDVFDVAGCDAIFTKLANGQPL